MQKMPKNWKNWAKVHLKGSWQIFTSFSCFSAFFDKHIHKMHKITSYIYDLRKILMKKNWSQGTFLGSLGPGSQEDLGLGPCRLQIVVTWGPDDTPVLLVFHVNAKNPNTAGSWCGENVALSNFDSSRGGVPVNPYQLHRKVLRSRFNQPVRR